MQNLLHLLKELILIEKILLDQLELDLKLRGNLLTNSKNIIEEE